MKIKKIYQQHKKYNKHDIKTYQNMKDKPILYVKNLTKTYSKEKPAISDLSFNVYPGQFHAFIGANGAGKTTTIKSLIGAYYQWSGTVLIDGIRNDKEEAKTKIGYIPENARFPDQLTAKQYLLWMIKLSGIKSKDANQIVEKKLKDLGMWNLRNRSPNTFSSGQKKKILLAQALIHDPKIIIMDEPVANLDPKARLEFFNTIMAFKKQGKAMFISSHVLAELNQYFDSATILDGGKIVYSGTKEELFKKFAKEFYRIKSSNDSEIKKYCKKNHIHLKTNAIDECLEAHFNSKKDIIKFQSFVIKHGIYLDLFERALPSLEQVYKRLVVKGSVDTMKGIGNTDNLIKTKK